MFDRLHFVSCPSEAVNQIYVNARKDVALEVLVPEVALGVNPDILAQNFPQYRLVEAPRPTGLSSPGV